MITGTSVRTFGRRRGVVVSAIAGPPPPAPGPVAGYSLLLDPSTGITLDGGAVASVVTTGTAGATLTGPSGAEPVMGTLGGLPCIVLDGTTELQGLATPISQLITGGAYSAYLVFKVPPGGLTESGQYEFSRALSNFLVGDGEQGWCLTADNRSGGRIVDAHWTYGQGYTAYGALSISTGTAYVLSSRYGLGGVDAVKMALNGGTPVTTALPHTGDLTPRLQIGKATAGGNHGIFSLAYLVLYQTALSDVDDAANVSMLMTKFGITAPWTPASLPSAWAWHDAGVLASLSKDAAGTTPVASDGDDLGRAADLSGNGRHLAQSNNGLRCDYSASGFGGLAAIHGGGGGIRLERTGGISGAQTWAITYKLAFVPGGVASLVSLGGTTPGLLQVDGSGSGQSVSFVFSAPGGTATVVGFNPTLDTAIHRLVITYNGLGSYRCWYDGVEVSLTTGGTVTIDNTLGAVFCRLDGTQRAGGALRRAAWSSAVASAGDIAHLDSWLQG